MGREAGMHEVVRYGLNGLVATTVHYSVLACNLHVLNFKWAGLANLVSAICGIGVSYLGNRYFVFEGRNFDWRSQVGRFCALYGTIAVLHGAVMWVWADYLRFDYRIGFLIATAMQFALSYAGNKLLVFKC